MGRPSVLVVVASLATTLACGSSGSSGAPRESPDAGVPETDASTGGESCGHGTITVTYQGKAYTSECFSAIDVKTQAAQVQLGTNGVETSSPLLTVGVGFGSTNFNTGAACEFHSGQTLTMSDPCIMVSASYGVDGEKDQWLAFGGGSPGDGYVTEDPSLSALLKGSLTINQWSNQVGGTVSVSFTDGATLILGPSGATVPISGSATGTIYP